MLTLLSGCGGGGDVTEKHSEGVELAARLRSDDALNIAIANVTGIRRSLGMNTGAIPPTGSDDDDLVFLDEVGPALGIVRSGSFPRPIVDEALRRARWIAGVAGDQGATAISVSGDAADFGPMLTAAGLQEGDGEYVAPDDRYAIALGDGLVVFADDPGDAKPVIERDDGQVPAELDQLDGDGQLITLARFGADCIDAVATADTPGKDGEIAFFTTATPDPEKITGPGTDELTGGRVVSDSARVRVPAAREPADEPPALTALRSFSVDYDCDA